MRRLASKGTVSMGQAQVCWDNAMAESLRATLKTEYYYRRAFTTRDQVYTGVATWIEDFYNHPRIHTSLGGKSPSKTNDTKRPRQQPHQQTINNLHTGPVWEAACATTEWILHEKASRPHPYAIEWYNLS